jgi:hypothetical protein
MSTSQAFGRTAADGGVPAACGDVVVEVHPPVASPSTAAVVAGAAGGGGGAAAVSAPDVNGVMVSPAAPDVYLAKADGSSSVPVSPVMLSGVKSVRLSALTQSSVDAMLHRIKHPAPLDESFGGRSHRGACGCNVKATVFHSVDWAMRSAITICALACILVFTPLDQLEVVASTPYLLPILGLVLTQPDVGNALLRLVLLPWTLMVGLFAVTLCTIPLFCAPIAQAVMYFPVLWLLRYLLTYTSPTTGKFATLVYLFFTLKSIDLGRRLETCSYGNWTLLVVILVCFLVATAVAAFSSLVPYPRFNCSDSRNLQRRIIRDATRVVHASLAVTLLAYHRPDEDDGDRSEDSPHAIVDAAEVHHVQLMEHLLAHLDDDLTAVQTASVGSMLECSARGLLGAKAAQDVATVAYAVARVSMGVFEENTAAFHGRPFRNFGVHSGVLYFRLLQRRREVHQTSLRLQVRARCLLAR